MNIKKIILNEIKNKKWTDLEIARYIYIRLGELLVFDPLYLVGGNSEKNKLFYKKIEIENLESNEIVCSTWAKIYHELLNEVGINSEIIEMKHCYVKVEIDGYKFRADATQGDGSYPDMTRIKYGDETMFFGVENLEEIDKKIGYKKGLYLNEVFLMLKRELEDETLLEKNFGITKDTPLDQRAKIKFEFIISLLNRSATIDKGYVDGINYLYELMEYVLTDEEYLCIKENVYYHINGNEIKNLIVFSIEENETDYYCYTNHENNIYSIEKIGKEKVYYYDGKYKSKSKEFYL